MAGNGQRRLAAPCRASSGQLFPSGLAMRFDVLAQHLLSSACSLAGLGPTSDMAKPSSTLQPPATLVVRKPSKVSGREAFHVAAKPMLHNATSSPAPQVRLV